MKNETTPPLAVGSTAKLGVCRSSMRERGVYGPCRDGFPQTGACWGLPGLSTCCDEEACGRRYSHCGGSPPKSMLTPNDIG